MFKVRSGGVCPTAAVAATATQPSVWDESLVVFFFSLGSQGIQMTATTPSMRAVRFETGLIELELSNRIQCKAQPGGSSSYLKLFGKCQVDLNLALGQIVKHQVLSRGRCVTKFFSVA